MILVDKKKSDQLASFLTSQHEHPEETCDAALARVIPLDSRCVCSTRPGVETIVSTISINGFRTFSRVFELTSQNCAPWIDARSSPSSALTFLDAPLSNLLPTKYVIVPGMELFWTSSNHRPMDRKLSRLEISYTRITPWAPR